ncbi:MAG TPA: DoxX family protein [Chryseobacterium sp.]|nr:DoxX family protein [Chryseobacterium sp.]
MKINNEKFQDLRLPIAISLFGQGLVRLPKLEMFSGWMLKTMETSMIPTFLLVPFSYILPILEFLIGLRLMIGYQSRWALYAGLTLMSVLIFGSCSIANWNAIEAQLIHAAYLFGLLWFFQKYGDKAE